MKISCLPGTNLTIEDYERTSAEKILKGIFSMTGGIYLSQLSELSGVPAATLQNWVKRGYVSSPVDRKYSIRQTTRMIMIALLRRALPMEDIVMLLSRLNHDLADESDDLIDDSQLYLYFCDIIMQMPEELFFDAKKLEREIDLRTSDFAVEDKLQRECLNTVLGIMVKAFGSTILQQQVQSELNIMKAGD